ncbi:hypothetical protein CCR75_001997 [Bremia lactucae]|uniref:Cation/H+ exchanger transmembrane domain-containing protein n=1 Tax=Bremia lactucae TaxID=4779 RepID=A0A976P042_BRELC|nr:hypothetical protein CCR75_001997 [Bremia lactucae]
MPASRFSRQVLTLCVSLWLLAAISASSSVHNDATSRQLGSEHDKNKAVPFYSWSNTIETLKNGLSFVMVLVAAHPLGLLFPKLFRLPLITGYLVIGIMAGPFVTGLISQEIITMLAGYVSALALSFISFQAGQEIYLPDLRPHLKAIMTLLIVLYITSMTILSGAILLTEEAFFYQGLSVNCQVGIALMFGSISVLGSPATVMAIKIELNSVGPFTSLMLGATMTAEFIVLVSFSISRIGSSIYCAELDVSVLNLLFTMSIVLANVLVGIVLAGVTLLIFKIPGGGAVHSTENHEIEEGLARNTHLHPMMSHMMSVTRDISALPHESYNQEEDTPTSWWTPNKALALKGLIWLSMGYIFYLSASLIAETTAALYSLSWEVKFEPLLVLMVASCIAGHNTGIRHDMHVILDTAAPYMFLPFFVMTGAALKLDEVVDAIPLMSVYVGLRYVAIFIACYISGRFLLKLKPQQYNNLWLTLTPQAGVALGLASEVQAMSDEPWAAEFAATILAAVVVNQIVGPVLCAIGLSRAGETLKDRTTEEEIHRSDGHSNHKSIHSRPSPIRGNSASIFYDGASSTFSVVEPSQRMLKHKDAHLPFYKVKSAVVIGDDEVALEVAFNLSLYGAKVNVPLLDKERALKWQKMNRAILTRTNHGDLISYENTLQDRDAAKAMSSADVIILTGDVDRTRENVKLLKSLLGENHPRVIALVPDSSFSKEMRDLNVLAIQPSIALANIATRMALLDKTLAEALSNELSTTSDFSTASYFLQPDQHNPVESLHLEGRAIRLGRSVVNHHSVDYDRLAEVLAAEHLPMPPPPSRVSMFGTSSAEFDPFDSYRKRRPALFGKHHDYEKTTTALYPCTPGINHSPSPRSNEFNVLNTPLSPMPDPDPDSASKKT